MYNRVMRYRPFILSAFLLLAWVGVLLGVNLWQSNQVIYPINRDFLRQKQVLGDYTYQSESSGSAQANLGIVYGFLPYWSVDNYQIDDTVSHVSYFRLAVDSQGNLVTDGGANIYRSPQMQQILDQINQRQMNLEVTIFTSHSDEIYDLVTCKKCRERLIAQIDELITTDRLDGINLDLEFLGTLTPEERQDMTFFLYNLKNMLIEKHPRTKLSIDVYGGAANMTSNLWDFAAINNIVDRVIIMGYDYKTRRADTPGSSSPTLGDNIWNGGIWDDVISMSRYIDAHKIILAIPFYGYAWETTSCNLADAKTYPDTGQTLTYRGAQNILNNPNSDAIEYWDEHSLTPYIVFTDDGTRPENEVAAIDQNLTEPNPTGSPAQVEPEIESEQTDEKHCHIGFFENAKSINYKIDLVENLNLGGIAIWALGYEGDYPELWQAIDARFGH